MKRIIKTLEEIGQNSSMNQFDSIEEMLKDIEEFDEVITLLKTNNDLVCGVFQEDEDDEEEEQTERK